MLHRATILILGVLALSAVAGSAQEPEQPEEGPPRLRATPLVGESRFDGTMTGPAWEAVTDSIANLITIEPEEGGEPEGRTVVKVLVSPAAIIIGVRCYDDEPRRIVSFSKARDSELEEEDHVVIVLDTFLDGRSGYVFAVNPYGARFDGLVAERGEEVNSDWDAIWEAKTSRDDEGWTAEIRIPMRSLSFGKDLTTWGFNVQRRVQRLQETSRWSGASVDFEIYQTSRAGLLTDLPSFDTGLGLSIRPSVVGRAGKPEPFADVETDGDVSLDVTQRLGPNLQASVTVNTDFAETEVDVRQINLTRFDLFFPEKRTFFLEGADIFEFGLGLDEDNLLPFFTRRIGLLDEDEIPINAGGKINGRIGNTNVGALVVNTRAADSLPADSGFFDLGSRTMGVLRVRQNVLEESAFGMLATFGDQEGRSGAWSAGLDFTFQTSNFGDEQNLLIGVWALLNGRDDLEGDRSAYGLRVDYPNDLVDLTVSTIHVGDGFEPSLGFVPRNGIDLWTFSAQYNPRPSWSLVRQMFHEFSLRLFNDQSEATWQSYEVEILPLDWQLESGDRVDVTIQPQGDRPPEDFELADEVIIPAGSYTWTRWGLGLLTAAKRPVRGEFRWTTGNYYNGDLSTIEATLAVKPSALFTLEFSAERNTGNAIALEDTLLVPKDFTEELFGVRLLLNISSDLQISNLTQYDTGSKELGSNSKLRWTFHSLGELFIVYNHNLERTERRRWSFLSNQVPVKIQYALRF